MNILRFLTGICLLTTLVPAWGARAFTYSYLATTAHEGEFEYAQWLTLVDDVKADPSFRRYEFRHEFELGLSDVWQLAFYLPDWRYSKGDNVSDRTELRDVGVETIYQIRDPRNSAFGIALYGEARLGKEVFALEPKLIIDKRINDWTLAWNLMLEAEWEGDDYDERKGEIANSFGASRKLDNHWSLGVEATWAVEYDDFSDRGNSVTYLGPNVFYKGHEWWIGGTLLKQLSNERNEPDTRLRLIMAFEFE